jgi:TetR/AcrR family tetracycline transcriptional repressor
MVFNHPVSTTGERAPRTRGGRQPDPIGVGDITAAALRLVERSGLDRLTVKAVADELGITSPAVYYYVKGKDALVERVCELVASSVSLDVEPGLDWQAQVVAIVVGMHRSFSRYPEVGVRALSLTGPAPAAERIAARVVATVQGAGFSHADAARLNRVLQVLFSGWLLRTAFPSAGHPVPQEPELVDAVTFVLAGFAARVDRES